MISNIILLMEVVLLLHLTIVFNVKNVQSPFSIIVIKFTKRSQQSLVDIVLNHDYSHSALRKIHIMQNKMYSCMQNSKESDTCLTVTHSFIKPKKSDISLYIIAYYCLCVCFSV